MAKKRPLRSKRTGRFVSKNYVKRWPHLVVGGRARRKPTREEIRHVKRGIGKLEKAVARDLARLVPREPLLSVGTELELTATTKGGTPRRDKRGGRVFDPAVLAVKVYATLRRAITFAEAARIVQRATLAGTWDRRVVRIELMDWSKGRREGQYSELGRPSVEDALVDFRHALKTAAIRVAVVDQ